jgi:hypothetical protein
MCLPSSSPCYHAPTALVLALIKTDFTRTQKSRLPFLETRTVGNVTVLEAWRAAHPPYGPCSGTHPHIVSCAFAPIERFFAVFRWTLPIYGALHVVPMLLFKRKAVARAPVPMILRAGWGSTRSAAFLGAFVAIYQSAYLILCECDLGLTRGLVAGKVTFARHKTRIVRWMGGRVSPRGCSPRSSRSHRFG